MMDRGEDIQTVEDPASLALLSGLELPEVPTSTQLISETLRVPIDNIQRVGKDEDQGLDSKNSGLRFGSVGLFAPWFPEVDPESRRAQTWRTRWSDRTTALFICQGINLFVLALNVACTIGTARYGTIDRIGTLYQGNCSTVKKLNSGLHLLINALSTILLGSSNYCMQVLVAPTRQEVNRAHARGVWLDIGVPSLRNLKYIDWKRTVGWCFLALSSGALHLVWNSAIFASLPYVAYSVAFVKADYLTNNVPWRGDYLTDTSWNFTAEINQLRTDGKDYERINKTACIERYFDQLSGAENVIVVTTAKDNNSTYNDSSSLISTFALGHNNDWSTQQLWMCYVPGNNCTLKTLLSKASIWKVHATEGTDIFVDYCLSAGVRDMTTSCGLHFSATIMIIVCCMNTIKCLGVPYTLLLFWHKEPSLVTLGDAIASFLVTKDQYTEGMCLASQSDFRTKTWSRRPHRWYGPRTFRMFSVAGWVRWAITISLCIPMLIIATSFLIKTLKSQMAFEIAVDLRSLWSYGLGQVRPTNLLKASRPRSSGQFWFAVRTANFWQLAISSIYLLYNALLSAICIAEEWSHFGVERKFLRVSSPRGMQRSTYFLSLPYRYGIPFSILISFLHWFISQSIFLVRAAAFRPDGARLHSGDSTRVGFSSIGVILSIFTGVLGILGLVAFGFRSQRFMLPMASTNSAAISAAAHRPPEDSDADLLPVKWGVVDVQNGIGHCSFTTASDVTEPIPGREYR